MNGTILEDYINLLMNTTHNSEEFRSYERMMLSYQTGRITDTQLLNITYDNLLILVNAQTDGNKALVLEAMENIEVIQEFNYQTRI